jgi:hypothetical protein
MPVARSIVCAEGAEWALAGGRMLRQQVPVTLGDEPRGLRGSGQRPGVVGVVVAGAAKTHLLGRKLRRRRFSAMRCAGACAPTFMARPAPRSRPLS